MERMEGVDAGYLYMETPTMHMHTLKIAIIEPREGFTFERFQEQMLARLGQLPPLQRRALPVPLSLNHPLWISDQPIEPARHLFLHDLPEPGGMAELEAVTGEIAGTPLDRSIPLWEMHVCQGMADGRIAVIGKMHHALADGVAANALLGNITDQSDDPEQNPAPQEDSRSDSWALEPTPTKAEQTRLALSDAIRQMGTVHGLLSRTASGINAVVRHRRGESVSVPRPVLDAPRASFNGALGASRIFATCTLPLDDIKQVRKANGVTVNDVVLAIVAGALRDWTRSRGEDLSGSLLAGVPVSTDDPEGPARLGGNRVSNLFTTLATDVDDPRERLLEISRTTAASKKVQQHLGPHMLTDWVQFTPPAPFSAALKLYSKYNMAARHSPPFNVIVSNVKGPAQDVTIAGSKLSDLFSVGPLIEGIGLNVTAWSYAGRLNVSILSCPDLVDDLGPLVARMRPALDELANMPD
ncbi:WS/DGAT/MGAT family O-acyltransferase [Williamsia muralis]|nr:wax ester/triacylglycerol synthase family O-acyltransferase [Williamsia muralis]